jgi:ribosome-associated protein
MVRKFDRSFTCLLCYILTIRNNEKPKTINDKPTILDISSEVTFQTTRSGGKGGQNVNKVETAVIGYFDIAASQLLSDEQKEILKLKLPNRINADGFLFVKSQTHRTQFANKKEVIEKINELVSKALIKKKKRLATKPSRQSREKRIEAKKKKAETKGGRKKIDYRNL